MSNIAFTNEEKEILAGRLQTYLLKELDYEIGRFDAEFLLDFITKELGAYYYNRGLYDARAVIEKRFDEFTDAVYQLEKPTDFMR